MYCKKHSLWIGLLTLLSLFVIYPTVGFSELTIERAVKKEVKKRISDKEIVVVPQLNKITTGFGRDKSGEFYWIKTMSKLFFQDKNVTVKVTDISFKDDGVIFDLWNDALGKGEIKMFFSSEGSRKLSADEIEEALRFSLSSEKNQQVVVNTKSKLFHLHTCNHLPESSDAEAMNMSEALNRGHKPCGYCFTKHTYLPDRYIENLFTKQIAAGQLSTNPLVIDQSAQNYIQSVGDRVLKKWPLPLLGYEYRFNIVESKMYKAVSLPGGYIIVTSALLNSLENESELEAVIAQQIAHIERRHILRTVSPLIEQQNTAQTMSHIAAGLAAGAAVASAANMNFNQASSFSTLSVAMIGLNIDDVNFSGYSKDYETEADDLAIFYFDQNYMDRKPLENIIRKSEFLNLATTSTTDIESLKSQYDEKRIAHIQQTTFKKFENKRFIREVSPPVQLDLIYQSVWGDSSHLFLYISDESYFDLRLDFDSKMYFSLTDERGVKTIPINYAGIVKDKWGAYIRIEFAFSEIIGDVKKVSLIQRKTTGKGILDYEESDYNFKEGVITFQ